jgi:hypothetical protein
MSFSSMPWNTDKTQKTGHVGSRHTTRQARACSKLPNGAKTVKFLTVAVTEAVT